MCDRAWCGDHFNGVCLTEEFDPFYEEDIEQVSETTECSELYARLKTWHLSRLFVV